MDDREPLQETDHALVTRANRGEEAAFEALYHRHKSFVLAIAYRFTRDREEALDVLQETFAYFFQQFPGFRLTAKLTSFLYPVTRHRAFKRRKRSHESLTADPGIPARPEDRPIDEWVDGLPEIAREIVMLRFSDGLSLQEISEALKIPIGTAKSRLFHALKKIRERHEPFGPETG